MPFLPAGVGAAIAGGVATAAVGAGANALISSSTKGAQSGAISTGQGQANTVLQPYVDTGENALTQYADASGVNGPDGNARTAAAFTGSPGYAWQLDQGLRGVDAGAASKGILRSGATIKAEDAYSQGLAGQDFNNYVSNLNNLSNLGIKGAFGQAGTDTSAAGQQASIDAAQGTGLSNSAGVATGALTNALTKYLNTPSSGSIYGSSGFQTGPGGTNSSGANTLQSLGLYNPLPTSSGGY